MNYYLNSCSFDPYINNMEKLTDKEEEVMMIIWELEKAFVKEVRERFPEPRPHINTVATVMRKLADKDYLAFEDFGSVHRFYPVVSKEDYTKSQLTPKMTRLFGNSFKNVVAFFAKEDKISADELKEIIDMIEKGEDDK